MREVVEYKGGDFREYLKRIDSSSYSKMNKALKVNNKYTLSIQCSDFHYCSPRDVIDNFYNYTSFEVAIFDKNNEFVYFLDNEDIRHFNRLDELLTGEEYISGYTPVNLIQDLVEYLYKIK